MMTHEAVPESGGRGSQKAGEASGRYLLILRTPPSWITLRSMRDTAV